MRHVIGDQFEYCGGSFRDTAGNRNQHAAATADVSHELKNSLQRDGFTAENVAVSNLSTFHRQDQAGGGIAHVDQVHGKIDVELKSPAEKMPEHGGGWREIAIVRPDWHGGAADDDRKTGCRGLHREPVRQHFRASIGTRRVVGRQQRIICGSAFRRRATEENGFCRAVQEPRNSALARGRYHHLRAVVVDGMKIAFLGHPHAGQTSKMVNLTDALQGTIHLVRIKHRTLHVLRAWQSACGSLEIKNSHLPSSRDERRDEVQPDEAGAASDEYSCHGCRFGSP